MATGSSRLDRVKQVSAEKETAQSDRPVIRTLKPDEEKQIRTLCELSHLSGELDPLITQHKASVGALLLRYWATDLWAKKTAPANPDIILKKLDPKGQPTAFDDVKCQLQVKFMSNGLEKAVPKAKDLPKDKTLNEVIEEMLLSPVVGLNKTNARKFVTDEVIIADEVTFAKPLNEMYGTDLERCADLLLAYVQARPKKGKTTVEVEAYTDAEESKLLVTKQTVKLKDKLFERICNYVKNVEELIRLIQFIRATVQVSNFEYGMSDTAQDRVVRLKEAVEIYLTPAAA